MLTEADVWRVLETVKDPEIPVISVVELGIVRRVDVQPDLVQVTITPTFSGCPALHTIQSDIQTSLTAAGAPQVTVHLSHSPPWSTNFITPAGRLKLKSFGLAPPPVHQGDFTILLLEPVVCPYCGSPDTEIKNSFGATLCRAIHYCRACRQAFEQFKPL